jgi:hypothetical protein
MGFFLAMVAYRIAVGWFLNFVTVQDDRGAAS